MERANMMVAKMVQLSYDDALKLLKQHPDIEKLVLTQRRPKSVEKHVDFMQSLIEIIDKYGDGVLKFHWRWGENGFCTYFISFDVQELKLPGPPEKFLSAVTNSMTRDPPAKSVFKAHTPRKEDWKVGMYGDGR
ncbi:BQ5605_C019g08872 [Microbotryum silenes-dioicae]|uniref:BQ5605_C019g08872 protein n=1 Tax=Microbotryum silenes-dioicae TaxID=796604 RepID=A0A2X0NZE3_9BASI|nr:BQ5605_C019g08872 [Microbotryum silenes-dioicae]